MQLVIKYGADVNGAKADIVVAAYADDAVVPMDQFPSCALVSWAGDLNSLSRVGPALDSDVSPMLDTRPHAAPTNIDLTAYAALRRYQTETGGITLNGKKVATDRQSQGLITAAWIRAQNNPGGSIAFKTGDGFVTLKAAEVITLGDAVANFVQACFQKEADLTASAGNLSVKKIDAAFAAIQTVIDTGA